MATLVARLVIVTVAPEITAPPLSVTVPVIVARSTWANATLESATVSSAMTARILLISFSSPGNAPKTSRYGGRDDDVNRHDATSLEILRAPRIFPWRANPRRAALTPR